MSIIYDLRLYRFKKNWKKKNIHNNTWPASLFDSSRVKIGKDTWGSIDVLMYDSFNVLNIGKYCSIAENVTFMIGGNHRTDRFSTFLFKQSGIFKNVNCIENIQDKGGIKVSDDVWIGYGSLILSGTKIGKGAVIGANSIVSGEVPPYAVYAGGRIIKYRFPQELIDLLVQIDIEKIVTICKNDKYKSLEFFYEDLSKDKILRMIEEVEGNYGKK